MQEVRRLKSDCFRAESGFSVYLSGSCSGDREWAGVGFVVAPHVSSCVVGFTPMSNRIASLKLKVAGGHIALVTVLAPHTLRPPDEKLSFYDELEKHIERVRVNGNLHIIGDLNARLGQQRPSEDHIHGGYNCGREAQHIVETPNRDLLTELCECHSLCVANTFVQNPPHHQVTYHELRAAALSQITEESFNVLDLFLVPFSRVTDVLSIWSDRLVAFSSHHFPVSAVINTKVESLHRRAFKVKRDWTSLKVDAVRDQFRADVQKECHTDSDNLDKRWETMQKALNRATEKHVPAQKTR